MAALTETLKTRIDAELKAALERQAAREDREVSQLVRMILRDRMIADRQLEAAVSRD